MPLLPILLCVLAVLALLAWVACQVVPQPPAWLVKASLAVLLTSLVILACILVDPLAT